MAAWPRDSDVFKRGLMPVTEFTDDGTLEISQIERLLETRCQSMLRQYESLDRDGDGTYDWNELLPIIKDFYSNLWNANRPASIDEGDDTDAVGYEEKSKGVEVVDSMGQAATLPPGWQAVTDPGSGRTYYANQSTGESSWVVPK